MKRVHLLVSILILATTEPKTDIRSHCARVWAILGRQLDG